MPVQANSAPWPQAAGAVGERSRDRPDWLYAALVSLSIVGFPLVSVVPAALAIPSRPISIGFRLVMLGLALGLLSRLLVGSAILASRTALACVGAFMLMLLLRIVWEASVRTFPLDLPWGEIIAFAALVSLLPALALLQVTKEPTMQLALRQIELLGAAALIALAVLGARLLGQPEAMTRLATDVLNPSSIGYLALTVFLVTVYRLMSLRPVRFAGAAARVLLAAVALLVMVATASKGPVLAALLVGVMAAFGRVSRGHDLGRVLVIFIVLCIVGVLLWTAARVIEDVTSLQTVSRFAGVLTDPSTSDRALLARSAFEQFANSPLIGSDLVERSLRAYPHNVMLEALLTTGIIGFIPFLGLNLLAFRAAWRLVAERPALAWVGLLHVQYQVAALLAGSLIYGSVSWAMLMLPIAAEQIGKTADRMRSAAATR